jgi:hypothetical protein
MLDATRYERVVIDQYRFRGFHGCDAWCALEILPASHGRTVVIATEVKDNPGTSITNSAEHVAHRVCMEFSIDPLRLVWIEHYGYPSPGDAAKRHPRTYDLVTFQVLPAGHDAMFTQPKWRPMTDLDWVGLGFEPRKPGP